MGSQSLLSPEKYEGEIDLRELVGVFLRGKWVIILTTVIAVVIAFIFSMKLPKEYEAEARVVIVVSKLRIAAQEGFFMQPALPELKTAIGVSLAPEVFLTLSKDPDIQAAWRQNRTQLSWQNLASHAEAKTYGKYGLLLLFRDSDPKRAALVVDRWAELVVKKLDGSYGWTMVYSQLQDQIKSAQNTYQQSQSDYDEVVNSNRTAVLEVQLEQAKNALACNLALSNKVKNLQEEVVLFKAHLNALSPRDNVPSSDVLSLIALQQEVWGLADCASEASGVQIQWPVDVTVLSVEESEALLDSLSDVLQQQAQILSSERAFLEAKVVQIEAGLSKENERLEQARQQRDTAWQFYQSLDALLLQAKVLTMPGNRVALIAAHAVVPSAPVAPKPVLNMILAGLLGFMVSSVSVFGYAWWTANEIWLNAKEAVED